MFATRQVVWSPVRGWWQHYWPWILGMLLLLAMLGVARVAAGAPSGGSGPTFVYPARARVPAWLVVFDGAWTPQGIELRWRFGNGVAIDPRVERAPESTGPWRAVVGTPQDCEGVSVLLDRDARRGVVNYYRLLVRNVGGGMSVVGTLDVAPVYAWAWGLKGGTRAVE